VLNHSIEKFKIVSFYKIKLASTKINKSANKTVNKSQTKTNTNLNKSISYFSNQKNNPSSSKIITRILTSRDILELNELKECTFSPKINNTVNDCQKIRENSFDYSDKLYQLHKIQHEKQNLKLIKQLENESKQCTFKPEINQMNRSRSLSSIRYNKKINKNTFSENLINFEKRKQEKMLSLYVKKMKDFETVHTFEPKITAYNSCSPSNTLTTTIPKIQTLSNTPRYIKLNQDYESRKQKLLKKKEILQHEFNDKNPMIKLRSKSFSNLNSFNSSSLNNSNYFEKLYEDANKIKNKKMSLISNAQLEYGFQPQINKKSSKLVNTSFKDRNEKLIKLKDELKNKIENEESQNKRRSMLSKEDIEKNNRTVVDRLYTKEIEKMKNSKKIAVKVPLRKSSKNEKEKEKDNLIHKIKEDHIIKFKPAYSPHSSKKIINITNVHNSGVRYSSDFNSEDLIEPQLELQNKELTTQNDKSNDTNPNTDTIRKEVMSTNTNTNEAAINSSLIIRNISEIPKISRYDEEIKFSSNSIIEKTNIAPNENQFRSKSLLSILQKRKDNSPSPQEHA
jgi:hypothetical protein